VPQLEKFYLMYPDEIQFRIPRLAEYADIEESYAVNVLFN